MVMKIEELIEALDQRYGNPYAKKECGLIQDATEMLRFMNDEIKALQHDIMELQDKCD
jgi:hypothetical protein